MTFDEVFAKNGGFWDKEYAMISVDQYARCIAIGSEKDYALTDFGKTLVSGAKPVGASADVVQSNKKRGRKGPQPIDDDFDLDDI